MPTDVAVEALPAERLRAELTRNVAARFSTSARSTAGKTRGSVATSTSVKTAADLDVVIDGERYVVSAKSGKMAGPELLALVHGAVDEVLGADAQVFVLHESDPAVAKVVTAVMEQLPEVVRSRRRALSERNIEALVDVYLGTDPLASAMPAIERDNAEAQARFLRRWPVLTADAVAEAAEHASTNRSATANRWKKARRIFGVRVSGREVYPAFQFQDGRPKPVVGKVLKALPDTLSGWQTAFWFTAPNGWLDDRTPLDALRDEPAVLHAAERERDDWAG